MENRLSSVVKRDGSVVPFDPAKIRSAIRRAGAATGEFGADEAATLTDRAVALLEAKHRGEPPAIERIQDEVEKVLFAAERFKTARAYIVY
ncbi:MAG: ribonucleoside triphosphate reductase, partial [Elusimicrobia bacterium]|nr:ribonucleoside triphosphate reductase [Elusimicrobiota bacterium]